MTGGPVSNFPEPLSCRKPVPVSGISWADTLELSLGDRTVACLSVLSVFDVGVLWPNGWMDQDDTWRGGGPQPWPHCVRWGPIPEVHSPGPIFGPCLLWPISCVIKMPLGTEVGLGSRPRRHCVRWGSSSSLKRGTCPPTFWPMSIVAKRPPISATDELSFLVYRF